MLIKSNPETQRMFSIAFWKHINSSLNNHFVTKAFWLFFVRCLKSIIWGLWCY
jgi:hypothetical protein